eukprot:scaffold2473_cov214-Chaetoceros_neogracile.AAC.18
MAVLSCCIRRASGWANAVVFFVGGWRLLEAFIRSFLCKKQDTARQKFLTKVKGGLPTAYWLLATGQ